MSEIMVVTDIQQTTEEEEEMMRIVALLSNIKSEVACDVVDKSRVDEEMSGRRE